MNLKKVLHIIWALAVGVILLILLAVLANGSIGVIAVCLILMAVLAVALVAVSLIWWRCPHCGRHLGRDVPKFCPHCGHQLDDLL